MKKKYIYGFILITALTSIGLMINTIYSQSLKTDNVYAKIDKLKVESLKQEKLLIKKKKEYEEKKKQENEQRAAAEAIEAKKSTIKLKDQLIKYKNTSMDELQSFINNNSDMAGTYFGSSFSGTDGKPTHFAGHDYGKFGILKQVGVGDEISVTDENNNEFTYVVENVYIAHASYVNGEAFLTNQNDIDFINMQKSANVEMIYLQTCASDVQNGLFDVYYVVAFPK